VAAVRGRGRRVSIPGVAELLRPAAPDPVASDERQATGREKHDQKITVSLSAAELLDLEHARLALRRLGFVVGWSARRSPSCSPISTRAETTAWWRGACAVA
jgi:hypothetical protein